MDAKTIRFTAIAGMTPTACGRNDFDINNAVVRNRPQTQLPTANGGATSGIIDDSASAGINPAIFSSAFGAALAVSTAR